MPLDYIPSPSNLINKLASFKKVVDVENSITVVEDMIEVFHKLLEKKATGIFHVVNCGSIRHKEILGMYKELVDLNHNCQWISEEELVKSGLAKKKRSNNIMQSENLEKLGIKMRPAKEAVREAMKKYAKF
jgi:dTDP-4-dehydrorhamnose reductase